MRDTIAHRAAFASSITGRHRRLPRVGVPDVAAMLVLALITLVVFLDEPHVLPRTDETMNLSSAMLPLYALYSLLRMLAAYTLSLAFAVTVGYWAATSVAARRVLLPAVDILQSVPILGFFPAAVYFFIRLLGGSAFGMELAAVFLIFTSQAWNLAFSVYESLTTIPEDIATAVRASGANGLVRWRRLILPACVPSLTYNSMLSWAAGWYFLIASEIITVGKRSYTLPGLGSYIGDSVAAGRFGLTALGLLTLLTVIVALHFFVWSPLEYESERYRYESSVSSSLRRIPAAFGLAEQATLVRSLARRAARGLAQATSGAVTAFGHATTHVSLRPIWIIGVTAVAIGMAWAATATAHILLRPLPAAAWGIPTALILSFGRLLVAYVISLAWTIPLAVWLSRNRTASARLMPIAEILASVPATAFFPAIVAVVIGLRLNFNLAAVVLILTGMQWYLLFNLVAAAQALPEDIRELAAATDLKGWLYARRIFLPAAMPHLITGSITAWGGGWNALVISEAVTAGGHAYSVTGIGALLDQATYAQGDLQMIVLIILAMVVVITAINRLFWRPLYERASERCRFEQ